MGAKLVNPQLLLQGEPFPKLLLLGEKNSGKTHFLYKLKMKSSFPKSLKIGPTQGYNFEIIKNPLSERVGILEIGSNDFVLISYLSSYITFSSQMKSITQIFYDNFDISGAIFIFDVISMMDLHSDEMLSDVQRRFVKAKKNLHIIMNEIEMQNKICIIIFNLKAYSLQTILCDNFLDGKVTAC